MRLNNAALGAVSKDIKTPIYDRSKITPGIVHIGVGNFHRAHQAWFLHKLMQDGKALDWGIIGAGVRPYDAQMRQKLLDQDCLTTLIELDPKGSSAEIVGSMIDYLPIETGHGALIAAMCDPMIRIVALTVTESGYFLDPVDGSFDASHEDIQQDIANPSAPTSAFGAIVAALAKRRAAGQGPFTLQSCDNLQGNGDVLRQTIVGLAHLIDPELAEWIAENCKFPNAMVDCIVPATGPDERALAVGLGIDDAVPVTHENFRQWVIEDSFCAGRPSWEDAGAILTQDVHAYESMKLRILNAGHQVLANVGEILSTETISATMQDPDIDAFFRKVQRDDILPYVKAVPGYTPDAYLDLIVSRFSNPSIRDTIRRVAYDGSARHSGFVLPILREAIAQDGASVKGFAFVEALWARMCAGHREDNTVIEANDPMWDELNKAALAAKDSPMAWLQQEGIYGELAEHAEFSSAFCDALSQIWSQGTRTAIKQYVSG